MARSRGRGWWAQRAHRRTAFYLDLAEWADDDPARWGPWAVRCPVSASDASHRKARLHRKSRMDTRTRERMPVLPTLVAWVAADRARTAELLAAAEQTQPGELFTAAGMTLRRAVLKTQTTGRVCSSTPTPELGATSASKNTAGSGPGPERCCVTPESASRNSPNCHTTASFSTGCPPPGS